MGVIGCATKAGLFKIKAIELKIICAAGYATQMPVNAKVEERIIRHAGRIMHGSMYTSKEEFFDFPVA